MESLLRHRGLFYVVYCTALSDKLIIHPKEAYNVSNKIKKPRKGHQGSACDVKLQMTIGQYRSVLEMDRYMPVHHTGTSFCS
jgi:hypothetical protein